LEIKRSLGGWRNHAIDCHIWAKPLWDAEGNASSLWLQYRQPVSGNWSNATVLKVDGTNYTSSLRVPALPTGSDHELLWYVAADLGLGVSTNIELQVCAKDITLQGDWSPPVSCHVDTTPDSDADGLPDAWELAIGFDPLDPADAHSDADADGDGFDNWAEYVADTNPRDANSYLRLSIAPLPDGIRLMWQGGVQATQYLQRRTNDVWATDVWMDILTNPSPTIPSNYLDLLGTNRIEWFRIRVER